MTFWPQFSALLPVDVIVLSSGVKKGINHPKLLWNYGFKSWANSEVWFFG